MALTLTLLLATLFVAALLVSGLVPERVTTWLGCTANVLQLHTISRASIRAKVARSSCRNSWSLSRRSSAIPLVSLP